MRFLRFGHTLLMVAGLSYLGAMLAEAQLYTQRMPLLLIAPATAIFVTTPSVTLIGQGLTRHFDPQQRTG